MPLSLEQQGEGPLPEVMACIKDVPLRVLLGRMMDPNPELRMATGEALCDPHCECRGEGGHVLYILLIWSSSFVAENMFFKTVRQHFPNLVL